MAHRSTWETALACPKRNDDRDGRRGGLRFSLRYELL